MWQQERFPRRGHAQPQVRGHRKETNVDTRERPLINEKQNHVAVSIV
jgi:hypothetical protein